MIPEARVLGILVLILISVFAVEANSAHRSDFGQPCNKTLRCKSRAWLSCDAQSGSCACAKPDEMMYDLRRQKCVSLIGEQCKFGFDDDTIMNAWYERSECVGNAVCGPSGICSCPTEFYEDPHNNQCLRVKEYGHDCENNSECNQTSFLICHKGQCQCDPDNAIYNMISFHDDQQGEYVTEGICVGRVGTSCSMYTHPRKYCVRNSYCNSVCTCLDGYSETSERLCGRGYGKPCSSVSSCSDLFQCTGRQSITEYDTFDSNCLCPQGESEVYDEAQKTCKGLVGSLCDPNNSNTCVDRALCTELDGTFQCECDSRSVDTADGKCQIAHGSECSYSSGLGGLFLSEASAVPTLRTPTGFLFIQPYRPADDGQVRNTGSNVCDSSAGLECKSGKCGCPNNADVFDSVRRKCVSPPGLRCNDKIQCVANATCVNPNNNFWGRCSCNEGFVVNKHRSCILSTEDDELTQPTSYEEADSFLSTGTTTEIPVY